MQLFAIAFALTLFASNAANARCAGAVMLGTLQSAYAGTLTGSANTRQHAAKTLLVTAGSQTGDSFGRQIERSGAQVDSAHLTKVLEDARDIATATLSDQHARERDFRHGQNVAWLADLYAATRCQHSSANASQTPGSNLGVRVPVVQSSAFFSEERTAIWVLAALLFFSITAIGGYFLLRLTVLRKSLVERAPRYSIFLPLEITYTDPEGELQDAQSDALDISQEGLKLRWEDPAPIGTITTVTLLGIKRMGRIVRTNPDHAGIAFEHALTKAELKSLKELHAPP